MLTALFVMLREGFEAVLVVAILYAYLRRTGRTDLMRALWTGVGVALAVSVAAGLAIDRTVDSLEGAPRLRAFAAISAFAVVVLTWMVFWMRTHARAIKGELHGSIDRAVSSAGHIRWAVTFAAFVAVARETLEAALFLIAAATTADGVDVLLGGVIGLVIAGALGWLVVLGGRRLPMRAFFRVTGVMLIFFAAGLLSRTVLFLQASGDLATVWGAVYDLTAHPLLTVDTEIGKFLGAMLGWDPRPSIEQVVAYLGYAVTATVLFLREPRPAVARTPERAG